MFELFLGDDVIYDMIFLAVALPVFLCVFLTLGVWIYIALFKMPEILANLSRSVTFPNQEQILDYGFTFKEILKKTS
ncbi:MAG: hypothetical protein GAK37_03429 [Pseudomonas sp.]|nr:MAG: hypothetical protein GAK37_03429 [Pseudomonas sp.]